MIPTNYYYLIVDLLCLSGPFFLSFQKRLPFFKYWKALLAGTLAMMLIYVPWDIFFTANGIWGFNSKYISGAHLGNLPIEEWLFFICIPYACIFSYECVRYFLPQQPLKNTSVYISGIYISLCLAFIVFKFGHWYTNSAAMVSIILLVYHSFVKRSDFMGYFHLSWWILLIPFYIANGVLTGLDFYKYPFINLEPEKISDQIVWYNNEHNLGIRIWTVPLDDFFYGMAMVLLALTIYEKIVKRQSTLI